MGLPVPSQHTFRLFLSNSKNAPIFVWFKDVVVLKPVLSRHLSGFLEPGVHIELQIFTTGK